MTSSPILIDQEDANLYRVGAAILGAAFGVLIGLVVARLFTGLDNSFTFEQAANWLAAGFGLITGVCFYVVAALLIRIYVVLSAGAGGPK